MREREKGGANCDALRYVFYVSSVTVRNIANIYVFLMLYDVKIFIDSCPFGNAPFGEIQMDSCPFRISRLVVLYCMSV